MVNKSLRDMLEEVCAEDALLFDAPSFDNSIIGISTDGAIIYSLSKMVKELQEDEGMSEEDAYEFIDYNTLNAHISGYKEPIILDDMSFIFEDIKEIQEEKDNA